MNDVSQKINLNVMQRYSYGYLDIFYIDNDSDSKYHFLSLMKPERCSLLTKLFSIRKGHTLKIPNLEKLQKI